MDKKINFIDPIYFPFDCLKPAASMGYWSVCSLLTDQITELWELQVLSRWEFPIVLPPSFAFDLYIYYA